MTIDDQMTDPGPSVYYDSGFRNVLEDHMTFLREHSKTTVLSVEPMQAYRFEGDFFGLLSHYNVPPQYQWLVMRMNKFTSPLDSGKDITTLLIPDQTTVDQIRQSHMTTRRIT